jgi:type IV secretory pathway VirD2 relaxase
MADLKTFTRDLVSQMEKDLDTRLDWVAVDHWNTEHPHVHLIVRGVRDDGQDLVISRDYIKEGMRDRARDLITQELGPRTDLEIRRDGTSGRSRTLDPSRPPARRDARAPASSTWRHPDRQPDEFHALKVGRLRKLEPRPRRSGRPGQWAIDARPKRRCANWASVATSSSACIGPDRSRHRARRGELCARRREP